MITMFGFRSFIQNSLLRKKFDCDDLFLRDVQADRAVGVECERFGFKLFEINKPRFAPRFSCIGWECKITGLTFNGRERIWRHLTTVKANLATKRAIGRIEQTNYPAFTVFTLLDRAYKKGIILNLKE